MIEHVGVSHNTLRRCNNLGCFLAMSLFLVCRIRKAQPQIQRGFVTPQIEPRPRFGALRVQTAQSTESTDRFPRNWPSIDPWRVETLKMHVLVPVPSVKPRLLWSMWFSMVRCLKLMFPMYFMCIDALAFDPRRVRSIDGDLNRP